MRDNVWTTKGKKKVYILYISPSACLHCDRWGDPRHHPQHSWISSCGDGSSSAPETPQSAITSITHQSASQHQATTMRHRHSFNQAKGGRCGVDRFGPFSNTARRMDGAANSNSAPSEKLGASHHIVCITEEKHGNKIYRWETFSAVQEKKLLKLEWSQSLNIWSCSLRLTTPHFEPKVPNFSLLEFMLIS